MSWGTKIAITYSLFVIGILSMVYIASKQTIDMQDDNYYEKELKYQSVIDAKANVSAATANILVEQTASDIVIDLPSQISENITEPKIEFIRPSDKKLDISSNFSVNENGKIISSKSKLVSGMYKMRLSWKNNDTPYFDEQTIFIN